MSHVSAERVASALGREPKRTAAHTYATVTEVLDSRTLKARLDGAAEPVRVAAFCAAKAGDRIAVTIRPDGRCVALGRRGGESWDSLAGKPSAFPADHLRGSVELAEGADLDDILEPGAYRIESNAIAQKIANTPAEIKTALFMIVHKGAFDTCITQEATSWTNGISARRSWHGTDKTWTDWVYCGGTSSIIASGTSGIWRYAKFSDGLVIMYGVATFSTGTWNAWGGMYEASRTWQGNLPVPLIKTGFEVANITLDSLQTCSTSPNSTNNLSTTKTNIYRPMRATTASSCTARINVLVVGRWK